VRSLRKDELEDMLNLTSTAFNSDIDSFRQMYERQPLYDFELTRVAVLDGELIAYLRAAPRIICIGGARVRMGGLAEVCTLKAYRNRGIATHLLREMIDLLNERGFPVSMLYGNAGFYGRVGWERCLIVHRLEVDRRLLPSYEGHGSVRDYRDSDLDEIMRLYRSTYEGRSCQTVRPREYWRGRTLKQGVFRVYDPGEVRGYLIYRIRKSDEGSRILSIEEIAYQGHDALRALVGNISSRQDIEKVRYASPPDDHVLSLLSRPGSRIEVSWDGMFRVNDVISTLKSLKDNFRGFAGRLALKLHDETVEGNTDTFVINGLEGDIEIYRDASENGELLEMDIRALSQLVPGTLAVSDLASTGAIEFSSSNALELGERLFPRRNPFQNPLDHF